jgi:cytochrome c-type biogenesis protein
MIEKDFIFAAGPPGQSAFLVDAPAAGWTPCVSPSWARSALAPDSISQGMGLLTFYSIGLGLPLLLSALGLTVFLEQFKRMRPYMRAVSITSGAFLILVGVMIFTNSFSALTAFLAKYGVGWYVGQ